MYRSRRVALRRRNSQHRRRRGGARCQMQKSTAGKFHRAAEYRRHVEVNRLRSLEVNNKELAPNIDHYIEITSVIFN
jgi:hypothetical protein